MSVAESETLLTPRKIAEQFAPTELVGQFFLSRKEPSLPWPTSTIDGWNLATDSRLPVVRIHSMGEPVGWLLGQATTLDGRIVTEDLQLPTGNVEDFIYSFGGRFVVILPSLGRIYLDSFGLLSTVYCAHAGIVASTPSLISYDDRTPDRTELLAVMGIPYKKGRFPNGLTCRENVERILPNHYLDLQTWKTVRHWPGAEPFEPVDPADAAAEIAEIAKNQLRAIYEHGPATLMLTAGRDSRLLLACSRAFAQQLDCITMDFNDSLSLIDLSTAPKLAARAGVRHRVMNWREPEERDLALWLYRTGFCVGEPRGWQVTTTMRDVDPGRSLVFAPISEMMKAKILRFRDTKDSTIDPERLLRYGRCASTPETLARIEAWLDGIPIADARHKLLMFWLEQTMGCWTGIWAYAAYCDGPSFPLSHRRVIQLIAGLPVRKLRKKDFAFDIIQKEWPELLAFPFNQPTLRKQLLTAARDVRDVLWAIRMGLTGR